MKKILGVSKGNFWIYIVGLVVGFLFICLYFINPENAFLTVLMSVGASLVGAIILAYFIERSNNYGQQQNKEEVRRTKTLFLLRQAEFVFERTVWYYFRILFDVLHREKDKEKCHEVDYKALWEELKIASNEIFNKFNANDEYSFEDYTTYQQLNEIIVGYYKSLIVYVEDIEKDIGVFEATGYFSHQETQTISAIKNLLSSINISNYSLLDDAFKGVFDFIMELGMDEANRIKYFPYYWKNGEVARLDKRFEKKIKIDDTKNAITSKQRRTDK